jgi:hypothetical protein
VKNVHSSSSDLVMDEVVIELTQNEGFISQDHIGGSSMKREYTNTTHKHTIP